MNKLLTNSMVYTIGQILPQAAQLFLLPIYTRYLTTEEFGLVNSMTILQAIFVIFFTISLDRSIMRLYYNYKSESEKRDFLGTITISIVGISLVFVVLLFTFSEYTQMIYKSITFSPFFTYIIFSTLLSVFSLVPKKYLMLKEKAVKFILISLFQFVSTSGFILWYVMIQGEGAVGYLKGALAGQLILLPIFIVITYKSVNLTFKLSIFKNAALFSLPIVPAILTSWVMNFSGRIFIERFFTLQDVGVYSLGYKLASVIILISGAVSMAIDPIFFRLANLKKYKDSITQIRNINNIFLYLVINVCFILALFSKEIIDLLFREEFSEAYKITQLLSLSIIFVQAGGITSRFFQQNNKMKENMYNAILAAVLNIILNYFLIPYYGLYGAAYATIISTAITFIIAYLYLSKCEYFVHLKVQTFIVTIFFYIGIIMIFQFGITYDYYELLFIKVIITFGIIIHFFKKYYRQFKDQLSSIQS